MIGDTMMWIILYVTLTLLEWTFKLFTLPFRVIGFILDPKPKPKQKPKPYSLEEMYFYDHF